MEIDWHYIIAFAILLTLLIIQGVRIDTLETRQAVQAAQIEFLANSTRDKQD